ncbi:Protein CBG26503 [Caenorhabditis briggsae]|uniref:Protein CBG26503 n=1 Tax=Caenorhabditis briggsae TaxID=6238 RepID=B6IE52_CAEBR|nr:Protein CBG26503 [Caenorhabditis briggsae]CAS01116.1 Protein CBG26503 [Caenorhabditis briggsae]
MSDSSSKMDPEPPEKRRKGGTPIRPNEERAESHRVFLQDYGFNDQLEPTIQVDEVTNEVIVALFCLSVSFSEIEKKVMRYLGVPDSRGNLEKTRKKLASIRMDWNKRRKRGEDKYLNFLKNCAFDKSFFCADEIQENAVSDKFQKRITVDHEITGAVIGKPELRVSEAQTEISCDAAAEYIFLSQKTYQNCKDESSRLKKRYSTRINSMRHWQMYNNNRILKAKISNKSSRIAEISMQKIQKNFDKKFAQLKTVKDVLKETEAVLQSALAKIDNTSNVVDLKEGKSYSNKTFETVIRLKSLGVADEKVGEVMEVVGNLVGVTFETLPCPSTCRNFALSSLYLGRSHVKRRLDVFLESDDSLCLASDETTKGTAKLQAFGIHSPDGNFTCLGVQPVAEKSAETAFNALEHLINQLPEVPRDFFKKLLFKITCTMSDSARTEIKFNGIVEEARAKAVPEIVSDFNQLSDTEKSSFFQFSQFFCQLHVLANYTDVVLNCMLGYEVLETGNNKLGEASVFGLIKLVNCSASGDPDCTESFRSGKLGLNEVGKSLENEMVIDHLQILGLCDQLITGPLWRLAEGSEHIFDTCKYAEQLRKWLEGCAKSPIAFFDGSSPTPNLQESSPTNSTLLLEALLRRDPKETTCDIAEAVCNSSLVYFDKSFANFLSGGKHFINQNEMRKSTEAAPATNRNIEAMFGLMSHYYDTKPNMRVDVRTAFTMLKKNDSFTWLQSLPENEQNEILSKSRAALKSLKKDASHRQLAIEIDILRQMKEKNLIAARKQVKEERDRFKYTHDILSIGFWASSSDVSAGLAKLSTEKQKREALTSQLRFRKCVIKQSAAAPMFSASAKSKPLPLRELIEKLEALIKNQHLSQQLLLMDHEYVGKRINQKISSKRSKGGFVEDIRIVGATKTIRVLFDGDSDPTSMNFDDFEGKLEAESIVFVV